MGHLHGMRIEVCLQLGAGLCCAHWLVTSTDRAIPVIPVLTICRSATTPRALEVQSRFVSPPGILKLRARLDKSLIVNTEHYFEIRYVASSSYRLYVVPSGSRPIIGSSSFRSPRSIIGIGPTGTLPQLSPYIRLPWGCGIDASGSIHVQCRAVGSPIVQSSANFLDHPQRPNF